MARRRLKLIFGAAMVKEPVIYQLGKQFEIITNIRRADVTRDQGWVLLEITGEPDELDRGVGYLESRGVKVEPAEGTWSSSGNSRSRRFSITSPL